MLNLILALIISCTQELDPSGQSKLAWLLRPASLCPKLPLQRPAALQQPLSSQVCITRHNPYPFFFFFLLLNPPPPCRVCFLFMKRLIVLPVCVVAYQMWLIPLCSPSVYALSGAIDLAAKSAGIIPGSPCRELTPPSVDSKILLSTTPVTEAEPDAELLQHNVPEVSGCPVRVRLGPIW